ncbi:hypothetical protein BH10ACT3_BH10ACT3_22570 [soil metagenome]
MAAKHHLFTALLPGALLFPSLATLAGDRCFGQ